MLPVYLTGKGPVRWKPPCERTNSTVDSQKSKLVRILRKCRGNKQGPSVRALPKFAGAQCTLRTIPTRVLLLLRDSGSCPHIVRIILVFAWRVVEFVPLSGYFLKVLATKLMCLASYLSRQVCCNNRQLQNCANYPLEGSRLAPSLVLSPNIASEGKY